MSQQPIGAYRTKDEETNDDDANIPKEIIWRNVIVLAFIHLFAIGGCIRILTWNFMWLSILWCAIYTFITGLGITAGAHRYWCHRTFKAKFPLQVLLLVMQSASLQTPIYVWCRDHRVHHKFSETNADPHNAKRGFFFSHIGWLFYRKHEAVKMKGKILDFSDLTSDPLVMFQQKYYTPWIVSIFFVIPIIIPIYCWGCSFWESFFLNQLRYCWSLHGTWAVNSVAHMFGHRPYDNNINPRENMFVSFFSMGEGWHNFHHVFPWDYKASEFGFLNVSKMFIEFFGKIGWAYDLKSVPDDVVRKRVDRTGSLTAHAPPEQGHWGWGDKEIPLENAQMTQILYKLK